MISNSTNSNDVISKLSNLSDDELLEFINNDNNVEGDELFFANRELRIRQQLTYSEKRQREFIVAKNYQKKFRIPFYYRIDFNSIIISLVSISILSLFLYFTIYKDNIPTVDYNKYNQSTYGIAQKVISKNEFSQGLDGANEITLYYIVYYDFRINSKYYSGSMTISNKTGNNKYLDYLNKNLGKKILPVRYQEDNPKESIIDFSIIDLE